MKTWLKLLFVVLLLCRSGYAQGFMNFDFEAANTLGYSPGSSSIPTSTALPGWSAYFGISTTPAPSIALNGQSIGGAVIALQDTNASTFAPIQGNYSVLLQGAMFSYPTIAATAAIGQTGTIPVGTQSLLFFSMFSEALQVSFNGQPVNYVVSGSTANYNIYAADMTAYAGQTGQLLFTAPLQATVLLDNIQFSTTPVPEPSAVALAALGGLLLAIFPSSRRPVGCQVKKIK